MSNTIFATAASTLTRPLFLPLQNFPCNTTVININSAPPKGPSTLNNTTPHPSANKTQLLTLFTIIIATASCRMPATQGFMRAAEAAGNVCTPWSECKARRRQQIKRKLHTHTRIAEAVPLCVLERNGTRTSCDKRTPTSAPSSLLSRLGQCGNKKMVEKVIALS